MSFTLPESLILPHGCRTGKISVTPANWQDPDASSETTWMIHYRFHDPNFAGKYRKGYPKHVKNMNDAKSLKERQRVTRDLLKNEITLLQQGYNPILKRIVPPNDLEISPSCYFTVAIEKAFNLVDESATKKKMEKTLPHLKKAIGQLKYESLPVGDIRQHHLEKVLIQVGRNKKAEYDLQRKQPLKYSPKTRKSRRSKDRKPPPEEWGAEAFNSYRAYLQILFKMLKKLGATEVKPVDDIEKKKGVKAPKTPLTADDWQKIDTLRATNYTFWRMIKIFHRSGARGTETMAVQREHVEIANQRFQVLVMKGDGQWEWMWKTITRDVLHLWKELFDEAQPGDFIFGKGLRPGPVKISARQLTIRWRWHCKEKLGIKAGFYGLKKDHTTKVINIALQKIEAATQEAAVVNGHKSTAMNKKHYDLEAGERLHRELSKL